MSASEGSRARSSRYFELSAGIVDRLRSRDERAYRELLEKSFTPLVYFANDFVKSYEVAEDIVQDTIVKILERGPEFEPKGPLPVYLYAAVRNRSLNYLEHMGVKERYVRDESAMQLDAPGSDETYSDINTYLNSLTERQRTAIQLRIIDQRTLPEISQILGVSVSATEQLVSRALKALREKFHRE